VPSIRKILQFLHFHNGFWRLAFRPYHDQTPVTAAVAIEKWRRRWRRLFMLLLMLLRIRFYVANVVKVVFVVGIGMVFAVSDWLLAQTNAAICGKCCKC